MSPGIAWLIAFRRSGRFRHRRAMRGWAASKSIVTVSNVGIGVSSKVRTALSAAAGLRHAADDGDGPSLEKGVRQPLAAAKPERDHPQRDARRPAGAQA